MVELDFRDRFVITTLYVAVPVREDSDVHVRFLDLALAAVSRTCSHGFEILHGDGKQPQLEAGFDRCVAIVAKVQAGAANDDVAAGHLLVEICFFMVRGTVSLQERSSGGQLSKGVLPKSVG